MTATAPPPLAADLNDGLKRLKMAAMRRLAPELLVTAKTQRWNPEEFLRTLVEAEITARDESNARTRMRHAAFPVTKTLDEFDVAASSIPHGDVRLPRLPGVDPRRGERLPDRARPAPASPTCSSRSASPPSRPGTGSATSPPPSSSRPSTAAWPTTPSAGSSTPCCATTWSSSTSSGFAPLDDTGAQLLFRFVAAAYERRSLGIGSHWPFESWGRFLPEHTTAVSMLDRLLHHCHIVVTDGDSYRMKQARAQGGTTHQDQLINHEEWGLSVGHQRGPRTGR